MQSLSINKPLLARLTSGLNKIYPLAHADNTWDNTGLLLDCSKSENDSTGDLKVLLTIDLTQQVAQEAIDNKASVIIAYHPFLFSKFNRISPASNPQHNSLVKLIANGISVYSPHTAVDAAKGGVNDWLVDGISKGSTLVKRDVIEKAKDGTPDVGMGRIIEFTDAISLEEALTRIKSALGLQYIQYASREAPSSKQIKTVAICAGSGSGVFKGVDADLYYTGELSHHEGLALKESDKAVVICNHSNTERGYLNEMKSLLEKELQNEFHFIISKYDEDVYQPF